MPYSLGPVFYRAADTGQAKGKGHQYHSDSTDQHTTTSHTNNNKQESTFKKKKKKKNNFGDWDSVQTVGKKHHFREFTIGILSGNSLVVIIQKWMELVQLTNML